MDCRTVLFAACLTSLAHGSVPIDLLRGVRVPSDPGQYDLITRTTLSEVCGRRLAPISDRVVGGKVSQPGAWPWQAGLVTKTARGYALYCGGTVISSRLIVTAAHCTNILLQGMSRPRHMKPEQIQVILGAHNVTDPSGPEFLVADVTAIHRHPRFDYARIDNDIALLKLAQSLRFGPRIAPACLPEPDTDYAGRWATVTGWGTTEYRGRPSTALRETRVPVISTGRCRQTPYRGIVTDNMICAGLLTGGRDACQGDSGGPLVVEEARRWKLIGVVSFGFQCATEGYPGIYTKVQNYVDWINWYIDNQHQS